MGSNYKVVTEEIARKVLDTVDAGLVCGIGDPIPGSMCVEAAVNFAYGRSHGDDPPCVMKCVRDLKVSINDHNAWPLKDGGRQVRANGMRRLAIAQLVSADLNTAKFRNLLNELLVNEYLIPAIAKSPATKLPREYKEKILAILQSKGSARARARKVERNLWGLPDSG